MYIFDKYLQRKPIHQIFTPQETSIHQKRHIDGKRNLRIGLFWEKKPTYRSLLP